MRPPPDPDDFELDEADDTTEPPALEVEITDPVVLGELYGPDGDVIATLVDRRIIPFGFQPGGSP